MARPGFRVAGEGVVAILVRKARDEEFWPFGGVMVALVAAVALFLPAIAAAVSDVGTPDNPVRLGISGETGPEIQILADALGEATGLEFVVHDVGLGGNAVGWLCGAYPDTGMLIVRPVEFVFANDACAADTGLNSIRFGSSTSASEFLVPQDSGLLALDDLGGLDWYFSSEGSLSSYVVPLGMLTLAGVVGYTSVEAGTHPAVVQAVYDNSVSGVPPPVFGTTFVDARTLGGLPADVLDEVRVLAESPAIPNDPIVFGPNFPADVRSSIEDALIAMADPGSPDYGAFEDSLGVLYSATGLDAVTVDDFAFLRTAIHAADLYDWEQGSFIDDNGSIFEADIEWMVAEGITLGCNPEGTLYCPFDSVTRAQMASFLVRALDLPALAGNRFDDVSGTHAANINALAEAGVTLGCSTDGNLYCPHDKVTREQMASFLARALDLMPIPGDVFTDVSGPHESNIYAIRAAGITLGCNPAGTLYCPRDFVTRGQMAAFLHRALG